VDDAVRPKVHYTERHIKQAPWSAALFRRFLCFVSCFFLSTEGEPCPKESGGKAPHSKFDSLK